MTSLDSTEAINEDKWGKDCSELRIGEAMSVALATPPCQGDLYLQASEPQAKGRSAPLVPSAPGSWAQGLSLAAPGALISEAAFSTHLGW